MVQERGLEEENSRLRTELQELLNTRSSLAPRGVQWVHPHTESLQQAGLRCGCLALSRRAYLQALHAEEWDPSSSWHVYHPGCTLVRLCSSLSPAHQQRAAPEAYAAGATPWGRAPYQADA